MSQPGCGETNGSFSITNYNATYIYTISPSSGVSRSGSTITAPTGTYSVTATLGLCTSGSSLSATVNSAPSTPTTPTLSAVTQPGCGGTTGSFTITNYNAPYGYTISPSSGVNRSGSIITAPPGTYSVTATLGLCTSGSSLSATVNSAPSTPTTPTLSAVSQPGCGETTGSFSITNYNASYGYTISPFTGVNRSGNTITAPPGTYSVTATLGSCTSGSSLSTLVDTIRAVPTLNIITTICSSDLTTYSISYTSNGTVSSPVGTVNNTTKTISNIPTGTNITLTSTSNGCSTSLNVSAPSCTCPSITAPTSGGNQIICSNESIPNLSANATGINETIDWYDSSIGGNLLQQGSNTFTPSIAGTYYAESRTTINGCKSHVRTPVSLIIRVVPTLNIITTTCSADLTTYSISFASNGTVGSSVGTVNNTTKTVSNIPTGTNITLTSSSNGCSTTLNITAPSCTCPSIPAPITGGNQTICSNESIPNLSATATGINETIDWYDSSTGGNLLQQGSSTYRPSIAGHYFAESRNTINGCKSSTRTPVSLIIRAVPTLSIITTTCSSDLTTYSISYASNGTVSSTTGSVNNTSKTISGIPSGTNVTLSSSLNGCTTTLNVTAPSCTCPSITAPTSGGNQTICSNESIPNLSATATGINETIDWYDSSTGGNLLQQGSNTFTPSIAGTYFAESRNTINSCKSSTRTPVSLIIRAVPTLSIITTTCSADLCLLHLILQAMAQSAAPLAL
ncbi:MAG: hypothetical protein IPO25_20540 [Saprospiraceae bacterium]|nr:hypothetical protein [Saprospiraceae bacterium]